ncbi:hypothetical protein Tco_1196443, partial [Tanacetum coccineum]
MDSSGGTGPRSNGMHGPRWFCQTAVRRPEAASGCGVGERSRHLQIRLELFQMGLNIDLQKGAGDGIDLAVLCHGGSVSTK